MRRTLQMVLVAGCVGAGSLVVAGPANAITNCSSQFAGSAVSARCTSAAGSLSSVRAVAYCQLASNGTRSVVYGNWVGVNQTSWADCGAGRFAWEKGYQLS